MHTRQCQLRLLADTFVALNFHGGNHHVAAGLVAAVDEQTHGHAAIVLVSRHGRIGVRPLSKVRLDPKADLLSRVP